MGHWLSPRRARPLWVPAVGWRKVTQGSSTASSLWPGATRTSGKKTNLKVRIKLLPASMIETDFMVRSISMNGKRWSCWNSDGTKRTDIKVLCCEEKNCNLNHSCFKVHVNFYWYMDYVHNCSREGYLSLKLKFELVWTDKLLKS